MTVSGKAVPTKDSFEMGSKSPHKLKYHRDTFPKTKEFP
ncbi:hypothetical protein LBBP_01416 [Leptospira borgpetersenii serovar Ballum]|uniref:Uncharacterized protein n=1 Tax=Leptospira borgpetersenii serovar Ballum TaxID=280505 RepID=A0A0S2IPW6_LEPBO|nr:hypothetical protein LBBP_01416 [Leptospira borgpetersenii serovar Ballum]